LGFKYPEETGKDGICRRESNLQKRVDSKKATKLARREKKLMRPGFEGRTATLPKLPST
jgi:hypothetical protein